jgi:hypothetical protein
VTATLSPTLVVTTPAEPDAPRRRRRLPREALLPAGLTALVLVVLSVNITGFPMTSDDEGTYLAQAWAVRQGQGLAHYTYWYDHPPLGWMQLAALSWLPDLLGVDGTVVAAARVAMLPVMAASLMLVYLVGRRLGLTVMASAGALLAFGLSPLTVTMDRGIYLDSFAVAWMLAALALALSPRRNLWHFTAAGAATAVSVLSKETMLLAAPAVAVALWQNAARGSTRPWAAGGYLSGLTLIGMFYPLYALLRGELFPGSGHVSLIGAWTFQLASRSGSGSVFQSGTGTSQLLHSWLYYDPVILIAGLAATLAAVPVRRLRPVVVAIAVLVLVALRPGGYVPAMYVVQVLPFLALVIAGVLDEGVRRTARGPRWIRPAAVATVALLVAVTVAPSWWAGNRRALTADDNAGYTAAAAYLRDRVPGRDSVHIVVDDALWLDCVRAGYRQENTIWFYKLDLDPGVAVQLPNGWRDIDYVVSTPIMRQNPGALPTVATLLAHSTPVAAFGPADGRIEIRRITEETS